MAVVVGSNSTEIINAADGVTEGVDTIFGYGGNDVIYGLGGNDTIIGGTGADTINGGANVDFASYYSSTAGVIVSLASGQGSGGDAEGDTLIQIENLEGSAYGDILAGDANANTLYGGGGDDILNGGGGIDYLHGGSGNDTLKGGGGADTLNGGSGIDTVTYSQSTDGVTISLSTSDAATGGDAEGDILSNIDNATGSNYKDTLVGTVGDNVLRGLDGHDSLNGLAGDDTLWGGYGNDRLYGANDDDTMYGGSDDDHLEGGMGADHLDGGDGNDVAEYQSSSTGVTVSLLTGSGAGGEAEGDTLINIEHVDGSYHGDTLHGNDVRNYFKGLGGTDTLKGYGGNDTLAGGDGQDMLFGMDDNDQLFGDVGEDFLDGGMGDDYLGGGSDNDQLYGGDGVDWLVGGTGNDYLEGGSGNDAYDVDSDLDTVVEVGDGTLDTLRTSVSYTLDDGCDIEVFRTTDENGFGSIDLTGNASSQTIIGNMGSNLLAGGLGTDTLIGLGGEDAFIFNTALGSSNVDTIDDYSVAEDQIRLDNAIFTNLFATEGNWLTADEFTIGAAAADADDRIIYNSAAGALFYDADGSGAGAAVQFATLSTGLALTSNEFFIV